MKVGNHTFACDFQSFFVSGIRVAGENKYEKTKSLSDCGFVVAAYIIVWWLQLCAIGA